jgi:uncharacterized protein
VHILILIIFFIIFLYGPQFLAKKTMAKNRSINLNGKTGEEFAQHLISKYQIKGVSVGQTDLGDHYDPLGKTVNLSAENFAGTDLSALVIAAHEVGHAHQDHTAYKPLATRTALALFAGKVERIGPFIMYATPVLGLITRSPRLGLFSLCVAIFVMGTGAVVNLITLPVEINASFTRAMPMLEKEGISEKNIDSAKGILWSCALTYFAASLASLLNIYRWFRIIRR